MFNETLEQALDSTKNNSKNYLIIMGDFNAHLGKMIQDNERIFSKYSTGKRSNNGQKLVEFTLDKNLTLANSLFNRKYRKKWTRILPDGRYCNTLSLDV